MVSRRFRGSCIVFLKAASQSNFSVPPGIEFRLGELRFPASTRVDAQNMELFDPKFNSQRFGNSCNVSQSHSLEYFVRFSPNSVSRRLRAWTPAKGVRRAGRRFPAFTRVDVQNQSLASRTTFLGVYARGRPELKFGERKSDSCCFLSLKHVSRVGGGN